MTSERRAQRIPALDGLRAFAVFIVLGIHADALLPGGYYGVDVFFVISGFLITTILRRELITTGNVRRRAFLGRRARRLVPALLLALATISALTMMGWFPVEETVRGVIAAGTYTTNLASVPFRLAELGVLAIAWSLAIEEQFYLGFPSLLLALRRWAPQQIVVALLSWFVLSSMIRLILFILWRNGDGHGIEFIYVTHYEPLLIGAALAIGLEKDSSERLKHLIGRCQGRLQGFAAFGVLCTFAIIGGKNSYLNSISFAGGFAVVAVATAVLIVNLLRDHPLVRVFSWRPIAYMGFVSYGIYLFQQPVIHGLSMAEIPGGVVLLLTATVATTLVAALSWEVVEKRFRPKVPSFSRDHLAVAIPRAAEPPPL